MIKLKNILNEAVKIQAKPNHWNTSDHIILVSPSPNKTYVLRFNNKNDSYPNSITFPTSMGTKPIDTNKAAREFWLKVKSDVIKWRNTNESVNEATTSDIIKDLDKVRNDLIKKVDVLIAKKKKLYSNVDIESPMSADEKKLNKDIADIFSQIQQLIQQKRSIKEGLDNDTIECEKCGWSWDVEDGAEEPYTCHKCGYDNSDDYDELDVEDDDEEDFLNYLKGYKTELKEANCNCVFEAEYKGREVKLGKPMQGDVKKFKVYVKNPKTGKVIKVNFGQKGMVIKKDNPAARKSFRARMNCDNPGPRTKANYWSCRKW